MLMDPWREWQAGSGLSDPAATPANRVQAGSETSFPSPLWSLRKMSEGWPGDGVSQQNEGRLSPGDGSGGERWRQRRGGAARGCGGRGGRPAFPPPGLGPQSLTCGPAPSRAPPASGIQVAGRGGWANDFLLPSGRPGSDSHAAGWALSTKGNLFAPHAPKQSRRGRGARGNSRGIWKACALALPVVRLALLRLLRTRIDLLTQISHIYTLPRLCLLPAGSVVGITKLCTPRKVLQQFYCNISILTSLNLVPGKQVYGNG